MMRDSVRERRVEIRVVGEVVVVVDIAVLEEGGSEQGDG